MCIRDSHTIFLAGDTRFNPELLLHELRHVQQFAERKTFPLHYIWESLRRGYHANRFEVDARAYAARCVARSSVTCLLYTSDAADERSSVDLGGRRIIKK